ncbi:hypothetical protein ACFL4D_03050 [Candidatus Margulisiibacteriota bacterium]
MKRLVSTLLFYHIPICFSILFNEAEQGSFQRFDILAYLVFALIRPPGTVWLEVTEKRALPDIWDLGNSTAVLRGNYS